MIAILLLLLLLFLWASYFFCWRTKKEKNLTPISFTRFSFRIDLDVDGPEKNTFVSTNLRSKNFSASAAPRKSGWGVEEEFSTT